MRPPEQVALCYLTRINKLNDALSVKMEIAASFFPVVLIGVWGGSGK